MIGNESDGCLTTISYAYNNLRFIAQTDYARTTGYRFAPGSLQRALSICELESVLSLSERPEPAMRPVMVEDEQS